MGESVDLYDGDKKIWEIQKNYDGITMLADDISSLGCEINVYQESINKMFPEYLVNFDYFGRVMENYGFKLITRDEANNLGLPEGSGLFSDLFNYMTTEIKRNPNKKSDYKDAANMTAYEKKISFLNRYFVYKKISNVNAEKVSIELLEEVSDKPKQPEKPKSKTPSLMKKPVKKVKLVQVEEKPKAKKLNRTLVLQADFEEEEEEEEKEEEQVEEEVNMGEEPLLETVEEGHPVLVNPTEQQEEKALSEKPEKEKRVKKVKAKPKLVLKEE
jgi:hypothetical protein